MTAFHPSEGRTLPSREISYAYAVAMHFAQHFEQNLRAILYSADYHGWLPQFELTEDERERFGDPENLIESATCGKLIEALRRSSWIADKKMFSLFERACQHRNKLAHSYLTNHDFDTLTKKKEEEIVHELYRLTFDLYGGLVITRAIRQKCEVEADKVQSSLNELAKAIGMPEWNDSNRHFSTRAKKRKK